jgi:DNA adenine methylase
MTVSIASTEAAPFLKWAGGKRQLLPELRARYPAEVRRYFEPFMGSGAVFFDVQQTFAPAYVRLSDNNTELVNCYAAVRDEVERLIALLQRHRSAHEKRGRDYYYEVREQSPRGATQRAARLIYLNKTCFNGLYRVNRRGQFNVPIGRYVNPPICDPPLLRAASRALRGVDIVTEDFAEIAQQARAGDFFYFDPPYDPLSSTSSFTKYTKDGFDDGEQTRLAGLYRELDRRGCRLMLSNSDTPFVRKLYDGFRLDSVAATRRINCNGSRRGPVGELVIMNYGPRS